MAAAADEHLAVGARFREGGPWTAKIAASPVCTRLRRGITPIFSVSLSNDQRSVWASISGTATFKWLVGTLYA